MFFATRKNVSFAVLIALFFINFLIWSEIHTYKISRNILTVAFLDVGQGDSIFIQSPGGVQVLIDGGSSSSVLRALSGIMPFYDRSIDMIIATHPDTDHVGGLIDILKRFDVKYIVRPGINHDTPGYEALLSNIKKEVDNGAQVMFARRGQIYDLGVDENGTRATLRILFPDRDMPNVESNTGSIVAKLIYGQTSVLLTGDAPKAVERYLVELDGTELDSDILKLGHHGSKTSSDKLFVGFVSPKFAIVSSGVNNRYGHPNQEVIDTLNNLGIKIKNTADEGNLVFESDGDKWTIK